jgi:hypothetical protein
LNLFIMLAEIRKVFRKFPLFIENKQLGDYHARYTIPGDGTIKVQINMGR